MVSARVYRYRLVNSLKRGSSVAAISPGGPWMSIASWPGARVREHPERAHAHDLEPDVRLGETLTDERIARRAVLEGERAHPVELAAEGHLLGERRDATLEVEQRHRDLPALARRTQDAVGVGARAVEEELVELRIAGHLANRP